jgi:hypothetical protein
MIKILKLIIVSLIAFLPLASLADVTVHFDNDHITGNAGAVVTLTGTLTNNSSTTPVYLTDLSNLLLIPLTFGSSTSASLFANPVSDSKVSLSLLPPMLNPLQQYSGNLAKISINSTTTAGDYFGGYNLFGSSVSGASSTAQVFQAFYVHINSDYSAPTSTVAPSLGGLQYPGPSSSGINLGLYSNGPRLIKLKDDKTIYWVAQNNLKIGMVSSKIFLSYHNKWEDVQEVEQIEFDAYPKAKFIRLNGAGAIYKISGSKKSIIPSSIWNNAGIDVGQIIDVNLTDFSSYPLKTPVENSSELN